MRKVISARAFLVHFYAVLCFKKEKKKRRLSKDDSNGIDHARKKFIWLVE